MRCSVAFVQGGDSDNLTALLFVAAVRKRLFRLKDAGIQDHASAAQRFDRSKSFVEHEAEMSEDDGHTDDEDDDEMDEELVSVAHALYPRCFRCAQQKILLLFVMCGLKLMAYLLVGNGTKVTPLRLLYIFGYGF